MKKRSKTENFVQSTFCKKGNLSQSRTSRERPMSAPRSKFTTEAKRCFATHDEDIDYFNMRIYYFNRMRIYSTVQLCSITSLWHSGQHLCRAIGRLQVRISLGFWLLSKRRSL